MATSDEPLPSNSLPSDAIPEISLRSSWPGDITREWAWGGSTGAGVRVCILDSGVDESHPAVGRLDAAKVVVVEEDGTASVHDDDQGDVFGHGTACAGIVRSIAPDCSISSVRVLGPANRGSGGIMLVGLDWAVREGYQVVNMSLSTTNLELTSMLHEVADRAYFRRSVLVASAHNMAVKSYPWQFSSVISVGSHEGQDLLTLYANPEPPVDFYARGLDIDVPWLGGRTMRTSGNSFATAHVTGICALVLAKHPGLTPAEVKSVLRITADNMSRAAA